MAISVSNLGASATPDFNGTGTASSYASSSWTPPTSGLIIVAVTNRAGTPATPTMSGNSLTWTQIATVTSGVHRLTLFAANASGSSTGATTVSFGANQLGCSVSFFTATGVDLSGGVAAAFVQTPTNSASNVNNLSVTLSAAANANNRPIAAIMHASNDAVTPRTNWTELDEMSSNTGYDRSVETQYRGDAFETTASASWTNNVNALGIAAELKAAGSGLSATVNQVTETDTAQAISRIKQKAIGQPSEADTAQAINRSKAKAIGQASETDLVQAINRQKIRAIGQVTETDTAQPITRFRPAVTVSVGQVSETDTAQTITSRKIKAVSQVAVTDLAQSITRQKTRSVSQVTETDTAQPITTRKIKAVSQVTETDLAQSITRRKVRAVSQVIEIDLAQAISHWKIKAIAQAQEADSAQSIQRRTGYLVAQVEETDLAQAFTHRKLKSVTQVTESDLAQSIRVIKIRSISQVLESDSAQVILRSTGLIIAVGQALEIDTAQPIAAILLMISRIVSNRFRTNAYKVHVTDSRSIARVRGRTDQM